LSLGLRVWGLEVGVWGLRLFRIQGFGLQVPTRPAGLGFEVTQIYSYVGLVPSVTAHSYEAVETHNLNDPGSAEVGV